MRGIADWTDMRSRSCARLMPVWLCAAALALNSAGCGYTILEHPDQGGGGRAAQSDGIRADVESPEAATPDDSESLARLDQEPALPPGHPPITRPEDWIGRSFLDHLVGEEDPLRFENIRSDRRILATSDHATLTLRVIVGGPAVADIWQLRIDEFGWVTAARWMQGDSGPQLDENLAAERAEFRLAYESEAALRTMLLALMPISQSKTRRIDDVAFRDIPLEFWPYDDPGMIEFSYRIERMDSIAPEDWPGGQLAVPVDLIQILIGTWDSAPPKEIQQLIWRTVDQQPLLIDIALLIEGIVLAWEVEGERHAALDLPLWVGR
ncbi:MAG: hypothetical protein KAY24_17040 [Candidatus Eisenbacteria sp.]|nr:hypothetical protein [Candidatus Eisenbacteria bacterium]